MRISLIVVAEPDAFNHKQRDFFTSIVAQTYPRDSFEYILVDGHARASTAKGFAEFRDQHPTISASLITCSTTARAAQNNLGAAHANGDLLVFLADDFDPSPGLIEAYADYHTLNPDLNAVGIGPGLFPESIRKDFFCRWLEDSGQVFGLPMRGIFANWPRKFFYSGNASIRREKFQSLGGFNEQFLNDAGDDFEFGKRLEKSGGYTQFVAGATAIHRHAVSLEERCKALEIAGISSRVFEKLHPDQIQFWRAMTHRDNEPILPSTEPALSPPAANAPMHAWIPFYDQQLKAAFRRGYFGGENTSC